MPAMLHPATGHAYVHLDTNPNVDVVDAAKAVRAYETNLGAGESFDTISAMVDPADAKQKGAKVVILLHVNEPAHSMPAHNRIVTIAGGVATNVKVGGNSAFKNFKPVTDHWCCWGDH